MSRRRALARARALAAHVGLGHHLGARPRQLSGGEMQRTAIARAVVHAPRLVIADEPTGNLDSENGARVLALLRDLNWRLGVAVLLATHDAGVAPTAHRRIQMRDGEIVDSERDRRSDDARRSRASL